MGLEGDTMNGSVLLLSVLTAGCKEHYESLSTLEQALWCEKQRAWLPAPQTAPEVLFAERAALHPEFAQVICIGLGFLSVRAGIVNSLERKLLMEDTEVALLESFLETLPEPTGGTRLRYSLCAHNGMGFGFLMLYRRLLAHGLKLPMALQLRGRKPWELTHLEDTLTWWRIGGWGSRTPTSLRLLAHCLGVDIPEPLQTQSGAEDWHKHYYAGRTNDLRAYAEAELQTIASVYMRLRELNEKTDNEPSTEPIPK